MRFWKLLIWDIAFRYELEWRLPASWGYLGPTAASYKPRPTPWLFRDR